MINVLLIGINAKYIHSNPAIYSLHAYANEHLSAEDLKQANLEIAEYTINQNKETILADIYGRKPDVAAFSCYIWNWNLVQEILLELPKILPKTQIWLGGPEVSFHGEKILQQFPDLKGIMIGEGEETFTELIQSYLHPEMRQEQIRGIQLRSGYTGDRALTDIDQIPFFYEDLDKFQNRIIYYESQRGCPFRCAYCLSSIDKQVRIRDFEAVKRHLQFFLDHKVSQVKFIDRTFNCNAKHATAVWNYLADHDNGVTNFHFEIAADLLTDEQLQIMGKMRPGLIQLEIGVQSTNERTLEAINRTMSIAHLANMVDRINSFGNIHQHLDLIAGLPFEDYDSFAHSFDDVYRMRPEQLQLGFLKLLKGSPMEDRAEEYGIVCQDKPPYEVLFSNWLSFGNVLKLKKIEEMVELYYNSSQFSNALTIMEKQFESPFRMYEMLASYYERKGYFIQAPARAYRYQVLLEFMDEICPDIHDLFVQSLIFDLYLRENLKSRPDFVGNQIFSEVEKEKIRQFYKKEAQEPVLLTGYQGYNSVQIAKMTHIERFDFSFEKDGIQQFGERLSEPVYIVFDYQQRNPLTYDANWIEIEW